LIGRLSSSRGNDFPLKVSELSHYWFRLAVPARYPTNVGQSEIIRSLKIADTREAGTCAD
jgi:hypothetical protein